MKAHRSRWLAALVLTIAAGGVLWFLVGLEPRETARSGTASSPSQITEATRPPAMLVEPPAAEADHVQRTPTAEVPQESEPSPRSRLFGEVLDERGKPRTGVRVVLITHHEGEGITYDAPLIDERWKAHGFETITGAAGHFELTLSHPTPASMEMMIRPEPLAEATFLSFGERAGRESRPAPSSGDVDLGTFRLRAAGAIAGRITDVDGAPIPGARVRLASSRSSGRQPNVESDADGRFVLGHVLEGVWDVTVRCEGYLDAKHANQSFRAGVLAEGVDFTLERAPVVLGTVRDTAGRPLAGVRVNAWPGGGNGSGAFAKTDEHGAFRLDLPQTEPYVLEVDHAGFRPWGGHGASHATAKPGTRDFEIVLVPLLRTRFVVVDDSSCAPIEQFGIVLRQRPDALQGTSWSSQDPAPRIEDHPLGEVELAADPELHDWLVEAPGFAARTGRVEPTDAAPLTVRLRRGGRITGRVLAAGAPLAGARARAERGWIRIDPSIEEEDELGRLFSDNYRTDLEEAVGRAREIEGSADGTFEIPDLPAGTWQLQLSSAGGAYRLLEGILVAENATVDLGDVELSSGGSIDGQVRLAGARSPLGLKIELLDRRAEPDRRMHRTTVDAEGRFRFEGLTAGTLSLRVEASPGLVVESERMPVEVAEGKPTPVTLDLAPWAPCKVHARVTANGAPVPDANVGATVLDQQRKVIPVGRTDARGEVWSETLSGFEVQLTFTTAGGVPLGTDARTLRLEPYGSVECEVALTTGSLSIAFPAGVALPERGQVVLFLERPPMDGATTRNERAVLPTMLREGAEMGAPLGWTNAGCEIPHLTCGTYSVRVSISGSFPSDERTPYEHLEKRWDLEGTVEVVAGETTRCELAEAENPERAAAAERR